MDAMPSMCADHFREGRRVVLIGWFEIWNVVNEHLWTGHYFKWNDERKLLFRVNAGVGGKAEPGNTSETSLLSNFFTKDRGTGGGLVSMESDKICHHYVSYAARCGRKPRTPCKSR